MILGKYIQLFLKTFIVFMVSIGSTYQSQASNMDGLIENFLQTNQEIALEYFAENIGNLELAISCLSKNRDCDKVTIDAGTDNKPLEYTFNQQDFLDFLSVQYKGYRMVAALSGYAGLNAGLAMSKRMALQPIKGIRPLIFDVRDEEGRQEIENIRNIYDSEVSGIQLHNKWLTENSIGEEPSDTIDMTKFFKQKLGQTAQNFPFFGFMTKHTFSKKSVLKGMKLLLKSYRGITKHISRLEGDQRYELFGFFNVFNRAISEFSQEEILKLQLHFKKLEAENTWVKQVVAIATSGYTWLMIGCWTSAVVLPAFAPLIGIVCGAYGLYYAIPGFIKIGKQTVRLQDYLASGEYSHDVYGRYMVNNAIAFIMYSVWFSSAIPSFTRNLVNIKTNLYVAAYATRWNGMRFAQMDKAMLIEEVKLFWSYTWYYGREMTLESMSENLGRLAGKANTLIPAVATTFWATANHINKRNPAIFQFTDLLKITREMSHK